MASTIQIKRGTGSAVPSGLADGELAINLDTGRLYFGSGSASPGGSTSINNFTFTNLTAENYIVSSSVTHLTTQTLSGSTTFGDDAADVHNRTGSFNISGNLNVVGTSLTLGKTNGSVVTIEPPAHDDGNGAHFNLSAGDATAGQTDKSGGLLALYSGQGTGTGASSEIRFYTAPAAGSTGTSLQSIVKAATITNDSKLRLDGGTLQGPVDGD